MPLSSLNICLFGVPTIQQNEAEIDVDTRKAIALIAYLAIKQQPVSRDVLATLLWTDYDDKRAKASLRRTLSVTRKALDEKWLDVTRDQAQLVTQNGLFIDVICFEETIQEVQDHCLEQPLDETCYEKLKNAIELYKGEFLAGFYLKDSENFDDWRFLQADRLKQRLNYTLQQVVTWNKTQQNYAQAIDYAKQWSNLDTLNEAAHYELIELYALAGQRSLALQKFEEYQQEIAEIGAEPMQEMIDLYEAILRGDITWLQPISPTPPPIVAPTLPELPIMTKPFVGRTAELADIHQLFSDSNCRLITIIAPGGVGKTRLALQLADSTLDRFPDGGYFIPLEELKDVDSILAHIGSALELTFYKGSSPKQQIIDFLRTKQAIIIFDGAEKHIEHAHLFAELVQKTDHLKIIMTSQERLNIQEEWLFQLQGVSEDDAVKMFRAYAKRVSTSFSENDEDIRGLCQLLGGMPLAIELAASWCNVLNCREIADEVVNNIDMLETSLSNVKQRHASLRAIFSYSWEHLDQRAREALQKLSIFHGYFTLQAIRNITNISLPTLSKLVQHALIHSENGFYQMPRLLRTYIREHNPTSTELEQLHSWYYAELLKDQNLHSKAHQNARDTITGMLPNILHGWQWAVQHQDAALITDYVDPLATYYDIEGRYAEALALFQGASAQLEDAPSAIAGLVMSYEAQFLAHNGQYQAAADLLQESLHLLRSSQNLPQIAHTLNYIGITNIILGKHVEAERNFREALDIFQELQDQFGVAKVLNNQGILLNRKRDYENAIVHFQRSLHTYQSMGDDRLIAYTLNNLGNAAQGLGKTEEAENFFSKSYEIKLDLNDQWGAACSLINLGNIARTTQRYDEARQFLIKSQSICVEIGKQSGVLETMISLAATEREQGDLHEAGLALLESLRMALEIKSYSWQLSILHEIALLYLARELQEEAIDLLKVVATDSRGSRRTRHQAKELLTELDIQNFHAEHSLEEVTYELTDLYTDSELTLLRHLLI